MTGSEKQVAWAEDIKAKYLAGELDKLLHTRGAGETYTTREWNEAHTYEIETERRRLTAAGQLAWDAFQSAAETKTDAKWWIDNRGDIRAAIADAYEAEIKRIAK